MHHAQDKLIAEAAWLIIISGRGVENLVGICYKLTTNILILQPLCLSLIKQTARGKQFDLVIHFQSNFNHL